MVSRCAVLLAAGLFLGSLLIKILGTPAATSAAAPSAQWCVAMATVPSTLDAGTPAAKYLKILSAVPPCPGVVAGVPVEETQRAQGPGGLTADSPWTETLVTATGKKITVTCGSVPGHHRKCAQPMPDLFTYQYVPSDGNASSPGSVTIIPVRATGIVL